MRKRSSRLFLATRATRKRRKSKSRLKLFCETVVDGEAENEQEASEQNGGEEGEPKKSSEHHGIEKPNQTVASEVVKSGNDDVRFTLFFFFTSDIY